MTYVKPIAATAAEFASWSGQPVFPVRGKIPAGGFKWRDRASAVAEVIALMPWESATGYGVALEGMTVVDIDDPADAEATAHWLDVRTLAVSTPRGGRHFYFLGDGVCGNGLSHSAMGTVDLKSDGGYVVGPGSDGYKPVIDGPDDEPRVSQMPDDLARWIAEVAPRSGGGPSRQDDTELQSRLAAAYRRLTGWELHGGGAGQLQGRCPQCSEGEGEDRFRIMADGGIYFRKCPDGGKAAWQRLMDGAGLTDGELRFLEGLMADRDDGGGDGPGIVVPAELWEHCEALADIRTVALKQYRSPIGLLGAVLARLGASDTSGWRLPPVGGVGTGAPLHLFVFLAAASGGGKSTVVDLAKGIIDYPPPKTDELGSGQGLFPAFGTYEITEEVEGDNGKKKKVPTGEWGIRNPRLLLEVDEGEKMMKAAGQDGSSLMAYLRMAWGGKQISAKTAGRHDEIAAGSYTFGIVAAGTWKFAAQLLGDQGAGDAERWLMLPSRDPHGLSVDRAAELVLPKPIKVGQWPGSDGVIDIAESVARRRDEEQARANINDEKLGHRTQNQLRIGAHLGWLAGHPGIIDEDDFEAAGHLMSVSDQMKRRAKDEIAGINRAEDMDTGVRQGRRDTARRQTKTANDRAEDRIGRLADKLFADGVTADQVEAAPKRKYIGGGDLTAWKDDVRAAGWGERTRSDMVNALVAAMRGILADG